MKCWRVCGKLQSIPQKMFGSLRFYDFQISAVFASYLIWHNIELCKLFVLGTLLYSHCPNQSKLKGKH